MGSETLIEVILAILLPPVGVFLRYGLGVEFWIDLVLTLVGYLPGIIYAIYILMEISGVFS
ncbi:salt stress-induced hydrophobic peptide ESI3 [Gossypium australe]|uniref:Salt stress-induced hydrophobic peptide ESI3 n=3 Tax=Gossypium TaxID=3633 RepID=A0A5B6V4W7_9ROSI|nr:salt stress-induced hydrophobic peptide ESI3 [Gossypium australe]